jgi:large subunit ribosomal protein L21e
MVTKSRGVRAKTRKKFTLKEIITPNRFLQKFEIGDKVAVVVCPSSHNFPYKRFHGKTGEVIGKRGRAYIVKVTDLKAEKHIIVTPEHLKKVECNK